MNSRQWAVVVVVAGSSMVGGANTRGRLDEARSQYRLAVSQHGAGSPEARAARTTLRTARQTYHTQRRRQSDRRRGPPPEAVPRQNP